MPDPTCEQGQRFPACGVTFFTRRPSPIDGRQGRRPRAADSDMPGALFVWDTAVDRVRSALTRSSVEVDFERAYRGEPRQKRSTRLWAGMCGGAVARLAHRLGVSPTQGHSPAT